MEVGQGPNWGCSAKEKKTFHPLHTPHDLPRDRTWVTSMESRRLNARIIAQPNKSITRLLTYGVERILWRITSDLRATLGLRITRGNVVIYNKQQNANVPQKQIQECAVIRLFLPQNASNFLRQQFESQSMIGCTHWCLSWASSQSHVTYPRIAHVHYLQPPIIWLPFHIW
jgi:hypothetical protein